MGEYRAQSAGGWYYQAFEADRNLEVVDPTSLRSVKRIYVVRDSSRFKHLSAKPNNSSHQHSSSLKGWWKDPEVKRKRRVAKYKLYSTEGKVKASFRRGFKWFKRQCSKFIHAL